MTSPEVALALLFTALLAAAITGAALRHWSIAARLYSLETQVAVLERALTSQIKREAALSRPKVKIEDELLGKIQENGSQPKQGGLWWMDPVYQKGK